jgi:hypothetical protein
MPEPTRIGVAQAALITSLSRRTLQDLAPSIPGASKPAGRWLFEEAALRAWINRKPERMPCRKTSTSGTGSIGRASKRKASNIEKAYELVLSGSRRSV